MRPIICRDVHETKPQFPLTVTRAGIVNFETPIRLLVNGEKFVCIATVDIFVDVPATKKGAHMSRNIEAIDEIFNHDIEVDINDVGDYAVKLAKRLAEKHYYASKIEVDMVFQLPYEKSAPSSSAKSYSVARIIIGSRIYRGDKDYEVSKIVGVEINGMTVCPNSVNMTKDYARDILSKEGFSSEDIEKILSIVPVSAHNQRGSSLLLVETNPESKVQIFELIDIIEESLSSPVYPILKRVDEQSMVIHAHKNPRFTEDVVRYMIGLFLKRYGKILPKDTFIVASQRNYESIHAHDVMAEISGLLGELQKEIEENGH